MLFFPHIILKWHSKCGRVYVEYFAKSIMQSLHMYSETTLVRHFIHIRISTMIDGMRHVLLCFTLTFTTTTQSQTWMCVGSHNDNRSLWFSCIYRNMHAKIHHESQSISCVSHATKHPHKNHFWFHKFYIRKTYYHPLAIQNQSLFTT